MPAHRNPSWSSAEVAILREEYPKGGINAVADLLSDRSWHSIYQKAFKLGLKCEREPDAPKCVLVGERLGDAIRLRQVERWSFARIGAHFRISESAACNAVLNTLCVREGHTPAERHANGRLTERGKERLRWCLKKGLKGVEIQLRLGVTASCIAEQRRRYNRELKAYGKALLPPPGAGAAYSGLKLSREKKREVEALFMEGFGTAKVSKRTGVSKTSCTRLRNALIRKLKRKGETLPGCDATGKRREMRDHARGIADEQREKLKALILDRVPVRRAAGIVGIGACSAYRIRDAMIADGTAVPKPRLPGKVRGLRAEMLFAQQIAPENMMRFRQLVREHGDAEARRILRAEIVLAKRGRTFEEQLEALRRGEVRLENRLDLRRSDPDYTLGGVTGVLA